MKCVARVQLWTRSFYELPSLRRLCLFCYPQECMIGVSDPCGSVFRAIIPQHDNLEI